MTIGHGKMALILSPNIEQSKYAFWKLLLESDVYFQIEAFTTMAEAETWLLEH